MVNLTRMFGAAVRHVAVCLAAALLAGLAVSAVSTTDATAATRASDHIAKTKHSRAKAHYSSRHRRSTSKAHNASSRKSRHTSRRSSKSRVAAKHHRQAKRAVQGKRTVTARAKRRVVTASAGSGSGGVTWSASASCLAGNLRSIVHTVAARFGSVRVNSTCRSRGRNRRVGGASKSWHLSGNAVDLRVFGNVRAAAAYLRSAAGGFKHYGGGLFHIDNGPNRSW